MLEGADVSPVNLVRVAVEVVLAERLQAGEHLVDLGLLAEEGVQGGFAVELRLCGAQLVAGVVIGFRRVMVVAP